MARGPPAPSLGTLPANAPGVPIYFERLAVTPAQITAWSLPTRPAKKTDPEAAKFGPTAVELDAIPPNRLTQLVEDAITRPIDQRAWAVEKAVEAEERKGLPALRNAFNASPDREANLDDGGAA